ncbi:MAG: hypothetical protein ACFE0I_04345 [Elainellaceae cyanobacterium]
MPWNLVDALSQPNQRREFFLPIASIPIGRNAVRFVDPNLFAISETYTNTADKTADVALDIQITPPPGGFVPENGLPDPAIRLHAVDRGLVRFQPGAGGAGDRLLLQLPRFSLPIPQVRWWQRWIEGECIPTVLIYENIDRANLTARLQAMTPGQVSADGLDFPSQVTDSNKQDFINQFLAGVPPDTSGAAFLVAKAGAYLGVAGLTVSSPDPSDPTLPRLLTLRARYHNHTTADPHPMNPRELFHLLFGNDSQEAQFHPLMQKIDVTGEMQTAEPETRRMRLRPPLRTWKRVEWEADLEINNHAANWEPAGNLGSDRLFNSHSRDGRSYNRGDYAGGNKCNLFVDDICLRAGFRVGVHPVGANRWHYIDANSHTNLVHDQAGATDRVAIQGSNEDRNVTWAWKFENWLRGQPAGDRQRLLNEAMTEEGRCFIVAGARARRFVPRTLPGNVRGVAVCGDSLRRNGIGHIVIVKEVLAQPNLVANRGDGLQRIRVMTMEASGNGAVNRDLDAQLGGAAGAAAGNNGFIRLHLFELHPGQDPDTLQGLRSLNIRNRNLNLLGTASERAANRRLDRNPDGTPRNDNQCCHDNHPPRDAAPTQVPC